MLEPGKINQRIAASPLLVVVGVKRRTDTYPLVGSGYRVLRAKFWNNFGCWSFVKETKELRHRRILVS